MGPQTIFDPQQPTALLYGLPAETRAGDAARAILQQLGVAAKEVTAQQLLQPVGALAGLWQAPAAPLFFGKAPDGPVLVAAGFMPEQLDLLLAALRGQRISIPLKAVLTPHNQSWSLLALIEELQREHAAMHAGPQPSATEN